MTLALQIAVGVWLGVLFLTGTFVIFFEIKDKIEKVTRYGAPWWRAFIPAR